MTQDRAPQTNGRSTTATLSPGTAPELHRSPPSWNPNTAPFSDTGASTAPTVMDGAGANGPRSPTLAAAGARTRDELLRRLSVVPKPNLTTDGDPKSEHPSLNLSGRIISAAFCIPYSTIHATGRAIPWNLSSRRGTSALFDSFSYLSSEDSPWKHTLVGWTGEIRQQSAVNQMATQRDLLPIELTPLRKASAPVPVSGNTHSTEANDHEGIHISKADRKSLEKALRQNSDGEIIPVWLLDELAEDGDDALLRDQHKWRRYAEHELYNLFHYKQNEPTDGKDVRKAWADYYRLNKAFAETILETYRPGDIVMIHDYHLMLLPSLLRQRVRNMNIGFFLHVPFPSYEFFRCLSRRKDILEGILGADMIGFQAFSYADHFKSCCQRPPFSLEASMNGIEAFGRHIAIDVAPIGINVQGTQVAAFGDPAVEDKIAAIHKLYEGKKVIVGRDRLDSVRGVAQKLQAYEIFLERHPEWHEKVVLIQVTSPTSIEDKERGADKTANEISDLVARINGTYGSLRYTPVHHYPQYLSREEYFALLRMADLGLITSVRDGMNTTSLEYVIAQKYDHAPLIISEFSGTAYSLANAVQINPWDLGGTAAAIHTALTMTPVEKQKMHAKLYNHVKENTVQRWTDRYLRRLLTNLASNDTSDGTPSLDKGKARSRYMSSARRLFMFDYDGTLTPIVKDPNAAIPTDRVTRNLKALAADPRNSVWIISGRDQSFLEEWLGHITQLGLSAEHGSFLRYPNNDHWENLTETEDMSWQDKVLEVFQHFTERTTGSVIERKKIALTWHYRRADPDLGKFQAKECKKYLENTVGKQWDVEVMPGKANIEVRPKFVNKGEIAKRLVEAYGHGEGQAPEFVLCLGDDTTDEDMFQSLRESALPEESVFSVTVGASSKKTLATWHLLEPADVISTIALLNGSTHSGAMGQDGAIEDLVPESKM